VSKQTSHLATPTLDTYVCLRRTALRATVHTGNTHRIPMRVGVIAAIVATLECGCLPTIQLASQDASADVTADAKPLDSAIAPDSGDVAPPPVDAMEPIEASTHADLGTSDTSDVSEVMGPTCLAGETRCGGGCVLVDSDMAHCGGCNRPCASSERCVQGRCAVSGQRSCTSPATPGCGLLAIPAGTLHLGEAMNAAGAAPIQSGVTVTSFFLDQYPVTVARFRQFSDAGLPAPTMNGVSYRTNGSTVQLPWNGSARVPSTDMECNWGRSDRDNHPINCVDWYTAQAFCVWDGG